MIRWRALAGRGTASALLANVPKQVGSAIYYNLEKRHGKRP